MGIDPVSLAAWGSIASTVIGAGTSAIGAVNQGRAQSQAAQYQAAVLRNNQAVAEWQARDAEARGRVAEQNQRMKTAQFTGAQRAAAGASGVDVNSGSAAGLQADAAMLGELDALTVRSNASREAWGHRVNAANMGANAGMLDVQAKQASQAGDWTAASSIIGGVSSLADKWLTFKQKGLDPFRWGSSTKTPATGVGSKSNWTWGW